MIKAAVIAGSPVDTQMGVEYINKRNGSTGQKLCEPIYLPVSTNCDENLTFQYSDYEAKTARINELFDIAINDGARDFFIYCNSLSGSFDFETFAAEKAQMIGEDLRVYTPLQIYKHLAAEYNILGVMAAHNLSVYSIEKTLKSEKEEMFVIGTGNMLVVNAVEKEEPPEQIIKRFGIADMVRYMEASGCEAFILGCTHFPYFKKELIELCSIPVIDPADMMFEAMISSNQ